MQGTVINNFSLVAPFVQTVYFYEQATTGPCFVQDDFLLTINPSPQISQRPISFVTCNQSTVLDDLEFGEYYKFPGGPSSTNPILPAGFVISNNDAASDNYEFFVYAGSAIVGNTFFQ